jgi:hypothetical protein
VAQAEQIFRKRHIKKDRRSIIKQMIWLILEALTSLMATSSLVRMLVPAEKECRVMDKVSLLTMIDVTEGSTAQFA